MANSKSSFNLRVLPQAQLAVNSNLLPWVSTSYLEKLKRPAFVTNINNPKAYFGGGIRRVSYCKHYLSSVSISAEKRVAKIDENFLRFSKRKLLPIHTKLPNEFGLSNWVQWNISLYHRNWRIALWPMFMIARGVGRRCSHFFSDSVFFLLFFGI